MLIGIDARYGFRKQRRGIGIYIYNLLEELVKTDGHRYVLYVDGLADPAVIEMFSRPPFTVRQINGGNLLFWEQVLLPLAARRDRLDILHCTANMAPLLKVCPTVMTILDVIEFRRAVFGDTKLSLRHRLSRLYRVGLLPALARRADLILTISEFSRQDIIEVLKLSPARVRSVYLGLPGRPSPGDGVSETGEKFILALGAMDNRKNLGVLFEAFHLYKKAVPNNVRLVVAGVERPELFIERHNLASHPFFREITCRGFVSDDELVALYRQCACFVYPSLYEGFGLPPLEAMAAGAPVIASKTTSVGEVVGGAGLLFDPRCPADLAEKIGSILADSGLADDLRKKGKERLKFFSWEKCAEETLAAYRDVYNCGWGESENAR
jgi:glycosyltransferase involved in cell wall biosynthesis